MTNERDELLEALGRLAAEERSSDAERVDSRFDDLAAGRLSPDAAAALRAESTEDEATARAFALFQPLDAELREKLVHAIVHKPPGEVIELAPRRRLRGIVGVALSVAAAAAIALAILIGREEAAPLPVYSFDLGGRVHAFRDPGAADKEVPVFGPGSKLLLELRPERPVSGRVEARAYRQAGGRIEPLDLPLEVSDQGAVRAAVVLGSGVSLPVGEWTLWVAVGRPGTLPQADELVAFAEKRDRLVALASAKVRISAE